MKTRTWLLAAMLSLGLSAPAWAVDPIGYTAADGVNQVPVTLLKPLPVAQMSGGGAPGTGSAPYYGIPLGYQQIAAATAQTAQSLTIPTGATFAVIDMEAGNARFRDDGTNPTTASGMPVYVGRQLVYSVVTAAGVPLTPFKIIDQDANGIVNISYYK